MNWLLLLAACGVSRKKHNALVDQLDKEVLALQERNATLWEELRKCSPPDVPLPIYQELTQIFAGTEITVSLEGLHAVVLVPGHLLFGPGDTELSEQSRMVTDLLATSLELYPDPHVWVIGHTDATPPGGSLARRVGTNWELSAVRAAAFARRIIDEHGIDGARFTVSGRGDTVPIADNDTPEGRAQNRRIVVVVGPADRWR